MSAIRNILLNRFNYGLLSTSALARTDLGRGKLGATIQKNVIGRNFGPGIFRPGLEYVGSTLNNNKARHIPFVFSIDDTALIEITSGFMRVRINDEILTRPTVSTTITNGQFITDLSGWTDADEAGATSYHSDTYMVLSGNGTAAAKRYQLVSVAAGDQGKEHALRFNINRGPVTIRVGSTLGGDEYVSEVQVEEDGHGPGNYSFAFTPTGDFYIEVSSRSDQADSLIDNIGVEPWTEFSLSVPYTEDDLPFIRYEQSGNVLYLACDGKQPKKIIRYGDSRSWGISDYRPVDGPFRNINVSPTTMTPSGLRGQITLTSSVPYFRSGMVGGLFKLTSKGQRTENTLSAADDATDFIEVTGVSDARKFDVTVTGTWSGTLQIQRSIAEPGAWAGSGLTSITTNGTYTYDDGADNSIYYYRVLAFTGFSGSAEVTISTGTGSITGVVRALGLSSSTQMTCSVLKPLGGTSATDLWYEGSWSDYRGYPSAVALHEGRLWWAGKDRIYGSVVDAYESFDEELEGDDAPINVIIGSGPIDTINSLLALERLVIFGETTERTARSTSLDEPLTPTNFQLKTDATRGSSPVQAVAVDQSGFFVRNNRMFQLQQSTQVSAVYQSTEATLLAPEVGESGFKLLAVQRYPDTRIHALREDGKVALFVFDEAEEVSCWQIIETDGVIEDVVVSPMLAGGTEDIVYYKVRRVINSNTVRYLEKWAVEGDCVGGLVNKQADSFKTTTVSGATISGLDHLEGERVIVWANGKDYSPGVGGDQTRYTVTSGSITLSDSNANGTTAVVGLPYDGQWKSVKLEYPSESINGEPLTQRKRIGLLGLIMKNTHNKAVQFGPDFVTMDDMPRIENGAPVDDDYVWSEYDLGATEFPGDFTHDPRVCLRFTAPRPATILGMVAGIAIHGKV